MVKPSPLPTPTERVDKWLWAVRLFKTRSLATEACRRENMEINGEPVKPARDVRAGEKVIVRQGLITRTLHVVGIPPSRVGAKQVPAFCDDRTPSEEFEKARAARTQHFLALEKGAG